MNYITQIKAFWLLHQKHELTPTDTALYFYLLEVCNSTNWVNPFKRNNAKVLADLHISRATFFRSRSKLKKAGLLTFGPKNGTANVTYKLTDLEATYRDRNQPDTAVKGSGNDTGCDPGFVSGSVTLNKNNKPKPKQVVVISCEQAFAFYVETMNNRMLKDRFGLDNNAMLAHFKTFYDSKIDLGDLDNKTIEQIARNFYYWLPIHLAAGQKQKEKSCAKKENHTRPNEQPLRGVAAAMKFVAVKMREE